MTIYAFGYSPILDEEFDAADTVADHDLCRALVAGKAGLHPDAWGSHDPLPLRWLLRRRREQELPGYGHPLPVENRPDVWNEHKPQPKPQPKPRPKPDYTWRQLPPPPSPMWQTYPVSSHTTGEVKLTCDECGKARLDRTVCHGEQGRPAAVAAIRAMGHDAGWTCIVGRDRCPKCSQVAPPQAIGNGAGPHQGNEQHP